MIKFNRNRYQSGGNIPIYKKSPFMPIYKSPARFMVKGEAQQPSPAQKVMSTISGGDKEIEALPADLMARDELLKKAAQIESGLNELDILSNAEEFQNYQKLINAANDPVLLNRLKSNKENYDKFVKNIEDKGSAYVTKNGRVLTMDKNKKLSFKTPEEIAEGGLLPLTTSTVANYRRTNREFAFDRGGDEMFTAIESTQSRKQILDQIEDSISNLGHEKSETLLEGKQLLTAAGKQGFDKFKETVKNNDAAIRYAKAALSYLNSNQKAQLKMAVIENFNVKDPKDIKEKMLYMMHKPFDKARISEQSTGYRQAELDGTGSGGRSSKRAPLGERQEQLMGTQSIGTLNLLNDSLQSNSVGSFIDYFLTDQKGEDVNSYFDSEKLTKSLPFNRTWVNDIISGDLKTLTGKNINAEYAAVDAETEGRLGYVIETPSGEVLNPYDKAVQEKGENISKYIMKKKLEAKKNGENITERDIKKWGNEATAKVYGNTEFRYVPKLFLEVYAGTANDKNQEIEELDEKYKEEVDYDKGLKYAKVVGSHDPSFFEEYTTILPFKNNFYKTVVMADLRPNYLSKARRLDDQDITIDEMFERVENTATMSTYTGKSNASDNTYWGTFEDL